ncbi:sodium/phosphate transporter, putative, partial [Ixodes scapularis]
RFVLASLLFGGMTILSTQKFDLGIAIIAMVHETAPPAVFKEPENSTRANRFSTFDWSPAIQGVVLGSYFYGVMVPQVLGGRLAERYSAKWALGSGMLASSCLSSMTPWSASLGVAPLVVHRIILGFVHGLSMPAGVALVARWAPKKERSTFMAIIFCGRYLGIVVAMLLFGHLSGTGIAGGWPFPFYVSGIIGISWTILWYFLAYDDPACDPKVAEPELRKIQDTNMVGPLKKRPVPWGAVLTSAPVWALVAARFSNMWVSLLLFTKLPSYAKSVLSLSIKENGNFSAIVFTFTIFSMLGSGICADFLLRQGLKPTFVRKLFQLTANLGPALCLFGLTVAGTDHWLVLSLLVIGKVTLGAFTGGNAPAVVDLAPMYSATLNGMITTFGQSTGIFAPLVAGLLIDPTKGSQVAHWSRIFYLSAAISLLGGAIFAIFGSAERQCWADPDYNKSVRLKDPAEEGVTSESVLISGTELPASQLPVNS